jgi:hypothetical protein
MTSIAIIGKGPSITKCNANIINSFDQVAIVNHPVFSGYEHLISNRAHIDFSNWNDPQQYTSNICKQLGIHTIINTGTLRDIPPPTGLIPYPNVKSDFNDSMRDIQQLFHDNYDLIPASGVQAIEFLVRTGDYNRIGLFGFDLMVHNEPVYYFPRKHIIHHNQYLFNDTVYSKDGIRLEPSKHDYKKTYKYIINTIKQNQNIQFEILSNRQYPTINNLTIL